MDAGFTLILKKGADILFSSKKKHLRPLVECINSLMGDVDGCVLYDKVVGLAAAKLIVYSGFIAKVYTDAISEKAGDYLAHNCVLIEAKKIIEKVMNNDKSCQCPMEKKAEEMKQGEFIEFCKEKLGLK